MVLSLDKILEELKIKIETKMVLSYFCLRCNKLHYEREGLYIVHRDYRDRKGIQMRTIEKRTKNKQTSLVEYGFPSNIPKSLKLGEKRK